MPSDNVELLCYNKGCGQTFLESDNRDDACSHHPGAPFFHDAYKGWSCCKKRTVDFTEFLNFKGCTKGRHSNVKPVEPEKEAVTKLADDEVLESKPTVPVKEAIVRPASSTPMVLLSPTVADSLAQQVASMSMASPAPAQGAAPVSCRRAGCRAMSDASKETACVHHPGYPVFHEGMKYWTCCQKKTTEFSAFLDQRGCQKVPEHDWTPESVTSKAVSCRHDWHQTAEHVVVSVFAKRYDPKKSRVELSPVRMRVELVFPEQESSYTLDVELRDIVDVEKSSASMFATKLEVKLKKAQPGSWSTLGLPGPEVKETQKKVPVPPPASSSSEDVDDDAVDLGDL